MLISFDNFSSQYVYFETGLTLFSRCNLIAHYFLLIFIMVWLLKLTTDFHIVLFSILLLESKIKHK